MVDQIHGSVDIVVQLFEGGYQDDPNNENETRQSTYKEQAQPKAKQTSLVHLPRRGHEGRLLYSIRKKDIPLIREQFQAHHRLLLNAYKSHAMYSCPIEEFESKISAFRTETNAYQWIEEVNESNRHCVGKYLDHLVKKVTTVLDDLLQQQLITSMQHQEMILYRFKTRLDYLFFLPDTRQNEVTVQPIIVSAANPCSNISRCLSRLLQPIYDRVTLKWTFSKGADAIQALEQYQYQGHLRSTTSFVTLHVVHLLTLFSHEQAVQILERFLDEHLPSKELQGLSISTILQLVRLLLDHQWFIYKNQIYRQTRGGACSSPMMSLLVNILLFDWQKEFVQSLEEKNELFGRCFGELFFTWNQSQAELEDFIGTMKKKNSTIQLQWTVGTSINYLDGHMRFLRDVDDQKGGFILETRVNHQSNAEPYVLPYLAGEPHDLRYPKLLRAALIRATLCCSDVYEFQHEQQQIKISFLVNDFSADFINRQVNLFFSEFDAQEFDDRLYDQQAYHKLRQHVLQYEQKRRQDRLEQQAEGIYYNLQYVPTSRQNSSFQFLKEHSEHHRQELKGTNHRKIYFDVVSRPNYPPNTK